MFLNFLIDDQLLKKGGIEIYLINKFIKIKTKNSKQKEVIIKQKELQKY
jgi:hypothetical protein